MDSDIRPEDLEDSAQSKIYVQDYSSKPSIEGVKVVSLSNHVGEDGDFGEVVRIDESGDLVQFPGFKIAQLNKTMVYPGTIKAWHLHLKQDEIWYVMPSSHLITGLWDLRKNSQTRGKVMRLALGGGHSQLLFIPKGVAHGYNNVSGKQSVLLYLVNKQFDMNNPDEMRIHWDAQGADFWSPQRD